jgi:hypothetical protein
MKTFLGPFIFWLVICGILKTNDVHSQFFGCRADNPKNYYQMVLKYPQDSLYRVYSVRYPLSVANNTLQPIIYIFGQNLKLKDSILLPKNHSFNFSGPIEFNNNLMGWLPIFLMESRKYLSSIIS